MAKIMIVDDSAFMRKILRKIITGEGYEDITEVQDGSQAVEAFGKEKPSLVLMDIIMEKKNGIDALKEIKKISPEAKVIMISAVGQEQMVKEAMESGAEDFIVKPFNASKVASTIKKIIS
jgi:two-component system chemotaxis response regulator CheY